MKGATNKWCERNDKGPPVLIERVPRFRVGEEALGHEVDLDDVPLLPLLPDGSTNDLLGRRYC